MKSLAFALKYFIPLMLLSLPGSAQAGATAVIDAPPDESGISDQTVGKAVTADIFHAYQPKKSSDTALDYRPELRNIFEKLPAITLKSLSRAITTQQELNCKAMKNKGRWINGKVQFGANSTEYVPSDEELLAAEYGNRLSDFIREKGTDVLRDSRKGAPPLSLPIEYFHFNFRHADVMGSGRYYYASPPEKTIINGP